MKNKLTVTDLFLAFLAIMLISVSFYQTWLGLEQIFGGSSVIIALVLSLILLFLLWQIRIVKLSGGSSTGLSWIYFFFATFCFVANFNALYTRFMRTDIYTTELREINEKFNNLETDVQAKLRYSFDPRVSSEIEFEKKRLMEQIINEGEPGIGNKARKIIDRIEKLTAPKKVTELRVINNDYVTLARQMGDQIDDMISQLSPEEKLLKSDINGAVLKWNRDIPRLLLLSQKEIDAMAQGQIDKSLNEYNKLGNKANTILGDENFKFTPYLSNSHQIFKIGYAFDHAFRQQFGMFSIVVLAGCILLDFGILIIILLMPADPRNINNNRGSVFNGNKRSGKTLIPKN